MWRQSFSSKRCQKLGKQAPHSLSRAQPASALALMWRVTYCDSDLHTSSYIRQNTFCPCCQVTLFDGAQQWPRRATPSCKTCIATRDSVSTPEGRNEISVAPFPVTPPQKSRIFMIGSCQNWAGVMLFIYIIYTFRFCTRDLANQEILFSNMVSLYAVPKQLEAIGISTDFTAIQLFDANKSCRSCLGSMLA